MKNQLSTINEKKTKVLTIDSRELSEMLERSHGDVMKMIQGSGKNLGIIPILLKGNFPVSDYFIPSEYKDKSGKNNKCYLVTKMGCELLGNKQQGEKGILFSAKYVQRFNEMEQHIRQENQFKLPQSYKEALLQLVEQVEKNEQLEGENKVLIEENHALAQDIVKWADESVINALIRKCGSKMGNKFGESWIEWKKNILYRYSININSRITNYLNDNNVKTKPKTLSMLRTKEELTMGLKVAISMCRDKNIDISDILGKHLSNKELDRIVGEV